MFRWSKNNIDSTGLLKRL